MAYTVNLKTKHNFFFFGNQITGTGHGIGKELALQYVALGCEVICVDVNKDNNLETVREANELQLGTAHEYTFVDYLI